MNNIKLHIFKILNTFVDFPDYARIISDDNIINITGIVGSGKSSFANSFRNNNIIFSDLLIDFI